MSYLNSIKFEPKYWIEFLENDDPYNFKIPQIFEVDDFSKL